MSSYPLPALDIRPQQQESPLDSYAKVLQMKGLMAQQQMIPGQMQEQQQRLQMNQLDIQNRQAGMKAMQQWDGKSYEDVPDLLKKNGADLSTVMEAKQKILEQKQKLSSMAKDDAETGAKNLETLKSKNDLAVGALSSLDKVPDEQLAQSLTQSVQTLAQQGTIDPQHAQMAMQLAQQGDPQKIRQGLDLFKKSLTGNAAQIDEAQKAAQARSENANAEQKELENTAIQKYGGLNQAMADSKYRFLQQQKDLGKPVGADDKAFMQAYEKQKTLNTQIRVDAMGQMREYPVIDSKTGSLQYLSAADLNKANQTEQGRYVPAGEGAKAMGKTALIEDIRGNIQNVRGSLANPKMPEFTAGQRAEIAMALGGPTPSTAISAAFRGAVLGNLTPEQQDYLINMAQLKENAMAMRSVLGAGQGSEDMRSAITATIPGPNTPSKAFAGKQLDKFEQVLNRLERGVPNVPLRNVNGQGNQQQQNNSAAPSAIGPNGHRIVVQNGRWVDAETGKPIQ